MSDEGAVAAEQIDALHARLDEEAEASGYHLNPDTEFARALVESLLINEERYGYWACPCRLADGDQESDLDIVCPCDYRDADLDEWGACYCALYVSDEIVEGKREVASIPERRPPVDERTKGSPKAGAPAPVGELALPVWRCRVCGYLAAREHPPGVCPICKAKKDRFERFW